MSIYIEPTPVQAECWRATIRGLFIYRDEMAGEASVRRFCKDFERGIADFDQCVGAYLVHMNATDGRDIYFADNSGTMHWYISNKGVYPSLRQTVPEGAKINYVALAQHFGLAYGRIHGTSTIFEDVFRSDPESYYSLQNGQVTKKSKNLPPVWEISWSRDDLRKHMERVAHAIQGIPVSCAITAGSDSRLILAHMLHAGMDPLLQITGPDGHPDVEGAKEIAAILGRELQHTIGEPEDGWLERAVFVCDGMLGVCSGWRLEQKAMRLREKGILLDFGGLGGEFYKNSHINLDFPFYGGKANWKRWMRIKSVLKSPPRGIFGAQLEKELEILPQRELDYLKIQPGKTKHQKYLSAYYNVLREARFANPLSVVHYAPCFERNVIAMAYHLSPYEMDGFAIHREQIAELCPELKDVKTNSGLTMDPKRKNIERIALLKYYGKSALEIMRNRNKDTTEISEVYRQGLNSPQCKTALERCRAVGVLRAGAEPHSLAVLDRLFAIGTVL